MDQRTNQLISDFINHIAELEPRLETAYVFGSYARGLETPDSDIDVALVISNMTDEEKLNLQVQFLLAGTKFDSRIEPHPIASQYFVANNPFVAEVLDGGIEVKPEMPG